MPPKKKPQTQTVSATQIGTKLGVATLALALSAGLAFAAVPAAMKNKKESSKKKQAQQEQMMQKQKSSTASSAKSMPVPVGSTTGTCPAVANIEGSSCSNTYEGTYVECHDGTSHQLESCVSPAEGKERLLSLCSDSCNPATGKCGVNTYKLGKSCEARYTDVTVTCHDGSTGRISTDSCQTPEALQAAAVDVCGCDIRTECSDSDGGDNKFERGRISGDFSPGDEGAATVIENDYTEFCVDEDTVAENFCSASGYISGADRNCGDGYTCESGECITDEGVPLMLIGEEARTDLHLGNNTMGSFSFLNPNSFDIELQELSVNFFVGNMNSSTLMAFVSSTESPITLTIRDHDGHIEYQREIPFHELSIWHNISYSETLSTDDFESGPPEIAAGDIEEYELEFTVYPVLFDSVLEGHELVISAQVGEYVSWENGRTGDTSTEVDGRVEFFASSERL